MLLLITLPFTTFVKSSNCDFVANVVPLVTDITLFEHATDVTALPLPVLLNEGNVISELLLKGNIVIAVGGGGIPVINTKKGLKGIAAVIDKDRSAALLAKEIDADILLILTAVDKVCLNYNTDHVRELDSLTIDEAYKYIEENQFAKGSMLPKIEACMH